MITVSIFNVRVVNKGDKYGRDFCLTHNEDKPLVEFYDSRYPHAEFGQFVTRYYVETILGTDKWGRGEGGLMLDGGVPAWTVSAEDMDTVRKYLKDLTVQKELEFSIKTEHGTRVHVNEWDDGGVWMYFQGRHASMSTAFTREEAEQVLAAFQQILSKEVTA
jgi:hypothetical protein